MSQHLMSQNRLRPKQMHYNTSQIMRDRDSRETSKLAQKHLDKLHRYENYIKTPSNYQNFCREFSNITHTTI